MEHNYLSLGIAIIFVSALAFFLNLYNKKKKENILAEINESETNIKRKYFVDSKVATDGAIGVKKELIVKVILNNPTSEYLYISKKPPKKILKDKNYLKRKEITNKKIKVIILGSDIVDKENFLTSLTIEKISDAFAGAKFLDVGVLENQEIMLFNNETSTANEIIFKANFGISYDTKHVKKALFALDSLAEEIENLQNKII